MWRFNINGRLNKDKRRPRKRNPLNQENIFSKRRSLSGGVASMFFLFFYLRSNFARTGSFINNKEIACNSNSHLEISFNPQSRFVTRNHVEERSSKDVETRGK